jgi:gluconate/galactonate dehydratase
LPRPLVQNGFIEVPDKPGLGIDDLNDEVLQAHLHPDIPGLWADTAEWDNERSHDRLWS